MDAVDWYKKMMKMALEKEDKKKPPPDAEPTVVVTPDGHSLGPGWVLVPGTTHSYYKMSPLPGPGNYSPSPGPGDYSPSPSSSPSPSNSPSPSGTPSMSMSGSAGWDEDEGFVEIGTIHAVAPPPGTPTMVMGESEILNDLRDQFAMHAMTSLVPAMLHSSPEKVAVACYRLADAMIEIRSKTKAELDGMIPNFNKVAPSA